MQTIANERGVYKDAAGNVIMGHLDDLAFQGIERDAAGNIVVDGVETLEALTQAHALEQAPEDLSTFSVEQLRNTPYAIFTNKDTGYKELRVIKGPNQRTTADIVALLTSIMEDIDNHNVALGFPSTLNVMQIALTQQIIHERRLVAQFAPKMPVNHPFEVARRLKMETGLNFRTRKFRQLMKKRLRKLNK